MFPKIFEDYEPRYIFNADETGLFWRVQPTKTFEFKGKSCYEGKLSKGRLSIVMANSNETEDCRHCDRSFVSVFQRIRLHVGDEKLRHCSVAGLKCRIARRLRNQNSFIISFENNDRIKI